MVQQPTEMSGTPAESATAAQLGAVAPYTGSPLVYGLFSQRPILVVLKHDWARRAADEFSRYRAARTWDEALAAAESMTVYQPPIYRDDAEWRDVADPSTQVSDEEALDLPFDPETQTSGRDEYQWPAWTLGVSLATMPKDWEVGEVYVPTFDPEYLVIEPDEEPRLLAFAKAARAPLVRDDEMIRRLYW